MVSAFECANLLKSNIKKKKKNKNKNKKQKTHSNRNYTLE